MRLSHHFTIWNQFGDHTWTKHSCGEFQIVLMWTSKYHAAVGFPFGMK